MRLPTGPSVTFLFTDIEGSTRLERAAGAAAWAAIVARHDALVRHAIEDHGGVVVKTEGDAFFAAFERPADAAGAAADAQRAIAVEAWPDAQALRVRMGLHLGAGRLRERSRPEDPDDYVGIDVNYTARIAAVGNGGQIVLSDVLATALGPDLRSLAGLGDVRLADDGPRIVKDFEEPARLHRLVVPGAADDERPLRTIEAPTNLPADVTTLVGRKAEIATIAAALGESRIVTLTGPGGSGKTRLALATARTVIDRFAHGTFFVDLAAVRDPDLIEPGIAAAIGVRESSDRAVAEVLRDHLRSRSLLLVLDNLEQLLPGAADVVSGLARNAPEVRVLVTSRELLRIGGERGYPVPPLDHAAGVVLFEDRARAQRPDLVLTDKSRAAIRAICERLGGLPLAIELAAARIRTLSPTLILERLGRSLDLGGGARDLPERQRTLRGAITWSHDLLADGERRLFRRLAVFAGGWTTEAVAAIADPDGDLGIDLESGLESLADKSLVRIELDDGHGHADDGEPRFGLHPLLREYAHEQLESSGERPAVERRHATVIAALGGAAGRGIFGPTGAASMHRLDLEEHNMRAALAWAVEHDRGLGIGLMGSTWRWFQERGRLRGGRALLAELLVDADDLRLLDRIAGLAAAGSLAYWMDDFAGARSAYEERFELASRTGDPALIADAHYDLGFLSMVAQDGVQLRSHEQQALDLYLAAGREDAAIRARQALVLGVFLDADFERARELQQVNLDGWLQSDSAAEYADGVTLQSGIYYRLGDLATSWARMEDGLRFFASNDLGSGLVRSLAMASIILFAAGEPEFGERVAAAAYGLVRDQNVMMAPVKVLHLPDPVDLASAAFGPERGEAVRRGETTTSLADVVAEVLAAPAPGGV